MPSSLNRTRNSAKARELERLGCTHAQGFLFARPLSSKAVEEMLVANQPLGPKPVQQPDVTDHYTASRDFGTGKIAV